jgi:cobalamin biosynthesis Co2+ chelatase CbiK
LVAQAAAMNSPEYATLVHEVKSYNIWFSNIDLDHKVLTMNIDERRELTQIKSTTSNKLLGAPSLPP